ncbi:MAG: SDR family oxidoreductase [Candidatus Nanopelagicaceae bacterium]|nr:SDR family oxidoreductase [Candidatus Nanopelagicaceae bacterium]
MAKKLILVTGGAGYIGSVLVRKLLEDGFAVRVYDRFFFGETLPTDPDLDAIRGDVRNLPSSVVDGVFGILDLAAISNDPAGELDPTKTLDINYRSRRRLQEIASESGVEKYVLASSCSVYGFQEGTLTEDSPTNPLTTYAEANIRAEKAAMELKESGADLSVTILRQATVYGLSQRMRFDLAINGMALGMWQNGQIPLMRDGNQWRPMVHVRDTSDAFIKVLKADTSKVNGETFNVGANDQNYQLMQLARLVAQGLNKEFKFEWYGQPDHRSYQVDFSKIARVLDFKPEWTVEKAAAEIASALSAGTVTPDERTKTMSWYQLLQSWQDRLAVIAPDGVIL